MSAPLGQCSIVSLPVDSFFLCFTLIMSVYLSARSTSLPQTHRCLLQNPRCPPCPVWDLVALLRGGCLHCHALVTLDSIHISSLIEWHWMQIFFTHLQLIVAFLNVKKRKQENRVEVGLWESAWLLSAIWQIHLPFFHQGRKSYAGHEVNVSWTSCSCHFMWLSRS